MEKKKKEKEEAAHQEIEELSGDMQKPKTNDTVIGKNTALKVLADEMTEAAKRGRTAFFIFILTGLILTIAAYNYRGSWLFTHEYRIHELNRAEDLKEPINPDYYPNKEEALIQAINRESENNKPDYKRHLLHDVWDGTFKTVDVPILGVEFYIEDLPLIGGLGLFLSLFWFYYARRREFSIIKKITEESENVSGPNARYIVEYFYNTVAYSQVFNKIKEDKKSFFHKYFFTYCFYFPAIVLGVVIFYDTYETFRRPIENKWIPDEKFYQDCNIVDSISIINPDAATKQDSIKVCAWKENEYKYTWKENAVNRAWDSIKEKIDSSFAMTLENLTNDTDSVYFKRHAIKQITSLIEDSIHFYRHKYFKHPTFWSYIDFNKYSFNKMNRSFLRLIPYGIKWDLKVFHIFLPIVFFLICYYLTFRILIIYGDRNKEFTRLEMLYEDHKTRKVQTFDKPSESDKDSCDLCELINKICICLFK